MSATVVLDWLNENSFRAYPLKEVISRTSGGYTLTDDIILDAQFVFEEAPTNVLLESIVSDTINVTFTINGLTFIAPKASAFPLSIRTSAGNLLVVGENTANIPNGSYTFTNVVFEPSVCVEFGSAWLGVRSLSFGGAENLINDIEFAEGAQFGINIVENNIFLGCGRNYGEPISCNSYSFITPNCDNIISFINGVAADGNRVLHLINGGGFVIYDDPPNHRIFVGLLINDGDVCKNIPINPAQLTF